MEESKPRPIHRDLLSFAVSKVSSIDVRISEDANCVLQIPAGNKDISSTLPPKVLECDLLGPEFQQVGVHLVMTENIV